MEFGIYKNVHILNKKTDNFLKVKEVKDFAFASELRSCIVTVSEFFEAAKSQPIVFAKTDEGMSAVALLGLKEDKNLFLDDKNMWKVGEYIPAFVRRYPFIFVRDGETLALALDIDAPHVNKKTGNAVLTKEGEMTEYTKKIMSFLESYQLDEVKTRAFLKKVEELEILEPAKVDIKEGDEMFTLAGFYTVSEEKLNALSDEKLLDLVKSGAYKLIVAHLISLTNVRKLAALL